MWEIGQRLVCIDDKNFSDKLLKICTPPKYGETYTFESPCSITSLGIYLFEYPQMFLGSNKKVLRVSFHRRRFIREEDYILSCKSQFKSIEEEMLITN